MVDKDQCKSGKEFEDLIGKAFPSPWDNNARHQNREGQISLNHKLFVSQFKHWLKHDLPNASNYLIVTSYFILLKQTQCRNTGSKREVNSEV